MSLRVLIFCKFFIVLLDWIYVGRTQLQLCFEMQMDLMKAFISEHNSKQFGCVYLTVLLVFLVLAIRPGRGVFLFFFSGRFLFRFNCFLLFLAEIADWLCVSPVDVGTREKVVCNDLTRCPNSGERKYLSLRMLIIG